jgi:hypothetical protein
MNEMRDLPFGPSLISGFVWNGWHTFPTNLRFRILTSSQLNVSLRVSNRSRTCKLEWRGKFCFSYSSLVRPQAMKYRSPHTLQNVFQRRSKQGYDRNRNDSVDSAMFLRFWIRTSSEFRTYWPGCDWYFGYSGWNSGKQSEKWIKSRFPLIWLKVRITVLCHIHFRAIKRNLCAE